MTSDRGGGVGSDDRSGGDAGTRWHQVAQRHFDPDDGDLTTELVFAIADARGVEPVEVQSPPLYECVDAAALEDTFFGRDGDAESRQGVGTVEFRYEELRLSVGDDGWIRAYESTDSSST